jgi:hypothetical protein
MLIIRLIKTSTHWSNRRFARLSAKAELVGIGGNPRQEVRKRLSGVRDIRVGRVQGGKARRRRASGNRRPPFPQLELEDAAGVKQRISGVSDSRQRDGAAGVLAVRSGDGYLELCT